VNSDQVIVRGFAVVSEQVFPSPGLEVTTALSEYKHKLVQGLELLQLHQDREFLGVRNCDSNFEAIAINGCQWIKTTSQLDRLASHLPQIGLLANLA
jgi:hypothetical protein